ncbi:MAG: DegV family protein [Chloroflexi bacterium]|nr:DegV family protein [Chloroflexota bacterium]
MNTITQGQVAIVSDTTASLPEGFAQAYGVPLAPQVILFGEESLLEEQEIRFDEFLERMKASPVLPRTAAPPPGEFVRIYAQALQQAETILSIHPSSGLSGTVRSAQTAKAEVFPDADIRILDTRTIGGALGEMVRIAVGDAQSGRPADEIEARIRQLIPRSRTLFAIRTLEYLQRGGRIGRAAALAGSLLNIKPLLQLSDGVVTPLDKVRTHSRALQRLEELVVQECPHSPEAHLCVMEADARQEAERMVASLKAALGIAHIPILNVGSAITTHAGPGVLGVSFFVE